MRNWSYKVEYSSALYLGWIVPLLRSEPWCDGWRCPWSSELTPDLLCICFSHGRAGRGQHGLWAPSSVFEAAPSVICDQVQDAMERDAVLLTLGQWWPLAEGQSRQLAMTFYQTVMQDYPEIMGQHPKPFCTTQAPLYLTLFEGKDLQAQPGAGGKTALFLCGTVCLAHGLGPCSCSTFE